MADIEIIVNYNNYLPLKDQMLRDIDQQCNITAHKVLARAQLLIQNPPKTGRVYGRHQASAPGQAPATDIGALASHSKAERESLAQWLVIFFQWYARILEYGTSKMAARPFLRPATESERIAFLTAMKRIVGAQ